MPTFYQYKDSSGITNLFDDNFIPAEVFRQGNLWVWGLNLNARLGINNVLNRSTPVTVFSGGTRWREIIPGGGGIRSDGSLWMWGNNAQGQLGTDLALGASRSTPVTIFGGALNWKQGPDSLMDTTTANRPVVGAIKSDGTLWFWGANPEYPVLGTNSMVGTSTPVPTFPGGNNWKSFSMSYRNVAAIKTDGSLWVWGDNASVQLGINESILNTKSTPVTTFLGGNDWKQVSCGNNFMLAIKNDGTLWAWGGNSFGQLGINVAGVNASTPVTTFLGGNDWKQVSCGYNSSVAIKNNGSLWVWGNNASGQLGLNDAVNRSVPTSLSGTNWKQISCGISHMAAIKGDGTLWAWGDNSRSQLGIGAIGNRSTPVVVASGKNNWKKVYCDVYSTYAIEYVDRYE